MIQFCVLLEQSKQHNLASSSVIVSHCSHAGGWGLSSALLATLTLVQFIYLFVVKERQRRVPNPWALFLFGVFGSIGIGAGVGGFAAYLGLGILDTINHRGVYVIQDSNHGTSRLPITGASLYCMVLGGPIQILCMHVHVLIAIIAGC